MTTLCAINYRMITIQYYLPNRV